MPALPDLPQLEECRRRFRALDKGRYALSIHWPSPWREVLWALGAFNAEVSKTAEMVSEPITGAIRLKWWQEVLQAIEAGEEPREHPVVQTVNAVVRHYNLPLTSLYTLIEARGEVDVSGEAMPLADIAALDAYAEHTGALWVPLASVVQDGVVQAQLRRFLILTGQLWALLGLLRATGYHLANGRCFIPQSVLHEHGLQRPEQWQDAKAAPAILHMVEALTKRLEPNLRQVVAMQKELPHECRHVRLILPLLRWRYQRLLAQPALALQLEEPPSAELKQHWLLMKARFGYG